jgi:hypothetical protein
VEHLVDGRLEQVVVVADHDQPAPVCLEEVAQPHDRVGVEVVGGLVEQQRVGPREEDAGQLDAPTLAAGQGLQLLAEDPVGDAQAARDLGGLGLRGVATSGVELGVGTGPPLHATLVDGGRGVGHLDLGLAQASYDVVESARGQDAVADDHLGVTGAGILREVAHVTRGDDLAGGRLRLAGEDTGESRLAGSVAPHEAHLVACGDPEGEILHEEPRAGSDFELLGGDHQGPHPTKG